MCLMNKMTINSKTFTSPGSATRNTRPVNSKLMTQSTPHNLYNSMIFYGICEPCQFLFKYKYVPYDYIINIL